MYIGFGHTRAAYSFASVGITDNQLPGNGKPVIKPIHRYQSVPVTTPNTLKATEGSGARIHD